MLFTSSQFKIADKFNDKHEFRKLKVLLHTVLGKNEDEVWSLVKIIKVMTIIYECLCIGMLQNFFYIFVRANNIVFDFTIVDFLLLNLSDLITVMKILSTLDVAKITETNKDAFAFGFDHIKSFLDSHYDYLAIKDIDLSLDVSKTSKVP